MSSQSVARCAGLRIPSAYLHHPQHSPRIAHLLFAVLALTAAIAAVNVKPVAAHTLQGSHESLLRQNVVAQEHDYPYLRTSHDVSQAVDSGELVEVHGNAEFELAGDEVSFPYARPHVRLFLNQLAHAYYTACGERLVVTSLTRPISRQPWNASPISVHPTGMAVDLRRSDRHACRQWLETTLVALSEEGMVEAIRERYPAHYHVAVFPDPLLLPGPIGDPEGVIRLAALHHKTFGTAQPLEGVENEASARSLGVRVVRSGRSGRIRITQPHQSAVARRSGARAGRISLRRTAGGRHRSSGHVARHATVARHRGGRSHSSRQSRSSASRSAIAR